MAQFNPDDPRHQREQQRAAAKRSMGPTRGVASAQIGEISGRHAGYQLGRQQQFRQLALSSELSKQRHAQSLTQAGQADQSFSLSQRRQRFSEKDFNRRLDREKKGIDQTMIMGLLGTGFSLVEARRREKILQSRIAEENYRTSMLEDYIMGARLAEEEQ